MTSGIIIKGIGGFYYVPTEQGVVECRARGKLRKQKITPMVGDRVAITIANQTPLEGAIDEILPRKNFLVRPPVANIDTIVIVIATTSPAPDFFLVDKLIASAKHKGIHIVLAVNKTDLQAYDDILNRYRQTGYPVVPISAVSGSGIAALKQAIKGQVSAFAGNSGVGKSSILNHFGLQLETGEVSKIERGKHTTRHVELFPIGDDGYVMDTPGFSVLELDGVTADELASLFVEFDAFEQHCRFRDCRHVDVTEQDCAIVKRVKAGDIAASRYESYAKLYALLKEKKEWEEKF